MTNPATAPRKGVDPLIALVLGWVVPGAGHIVIGQVRKGIFFFAILLVTFVAGLLLADFRTVRASDNPFYFVGQVGSGLNLLLTSLCTNLHPRGWLSQVYFEPGLLYMSVSGLLNILVVMSVLPQPAALAAPVDKVSGTAEAAASSGGSSAGAAPQA